MHCQIRVFMNNVHKHIAVRERYNQFFLTLANKRLLFGFAGFYFIANEFPLQAPGLARRTLADHKFTFILY